MHTDYDSNDGGVDNCDLKMNTHVRLHVFVLAHHQLMTRTQDPRVCDLRTSTAEDDLC